MKFQMPNFKYQMSNEKSRFEIGYLSRGFTLPELIISIVVIGLLATIVIINVVGVKQRTSLQTTADVLIADMKEQQLKAMVGDTEGRGVRDNYGIHPLSNSYILFHGSSYNANASGNFTVNLGDNVEFTAGSDIVFSENSGELTGGATTMTLHEKTTNSTKTINLNSYGNVTNLN